MDTPLSESRFADVLEGWVDENRESHDEHDAHVVHQDNEHDDHDEGHDEHEDEEHDHDDGELGDFLLSNWTFWYIWRLQNKNSVHFPINTDGIPEHITWIFILISIEHDDEAENSQEIAENDDEKDDKDLDDDEKDEGFEDGDEADDDEVSVQRFSWATIFPAVISLIQWVWKWLKL